MPGTAKFDRSVELKRIFNRELDKWRRKHGGGLEDLAALCGVSPAYLAHVKRYGRIPGKPVLILLALHFELKNPEIFFHAAGIEGAFPFSQAVRIEKLDSAKDQLFSFSLNSEALALSIRDAIRQELSGTSQSEFTSSSTIRLGLNVEQSAFFGEDTSQGFFPELIDMLSTNLRCKIDTIPIPRSEYRTKIKSGKIDIYGPILPDFPSQGVLFTKPFCRLGRSALVRKNFVDSLEDLPQPQTMDCLAQHPYKIAVIRDSREHVFANITLQKRDSELVICDSIEEAVE